MISKKTIEAVRDLPIQDVLKSFGVDLKLRGKTYFACCPFHSERTPSFTVTRGKNVYFCQSCKKGGDTIGFVMEKEGLDFNSAVEAIARSANVRIEYTKSDQTEEERQANLHRESLFNAVAAVQKFFEDQLRVQMNDEARVASEYAYSRWPEEFCAQTGIGLAPADRYALVNHCRSRGMSEDLLLELGILGRSEARGTLYSKFRNRLTIPIRDRYGRVIAFTARYLGDAKADGTGKYINSSNSTLFNKSESIFGIDRASRCSDAEYFNIVEGAPDALRMQSVGLLNTVAANGTAWNDGQFEQLKKFTSSLCFIPDSDVPKGGEAYGPGFKAVMHNGAAAMRRGFNVTVRELPFYYTAVTVPLFDYEIEQAQEELLERKKKEARKSGMAARDVRELSLTQAELAAIPRHRTIARTPHKNDPDEYIDSRETYAAIPEEHFVVWLAAKRFAITDSTAEQRKLFGEIADLLRFVSDKILLDEMIDQLSNVYGKAKFWRDAVDRAKGLARQAVLNREPENDRDRDIALLGKFNLSIRDNCYFTHDGDGEPIRLSNFILEPLFHVQDESNGTRIFRMKNSFGDVRVIELRESELCSLAAFNQRVSSLGNFVWRAKADKLNNVKEYTYAKTNSAERITKLGWNIADEYFAFGNGVFIDGEFRKVDDLGIVRDVRNTNYYIPATSKMYANNPEIFQFERLMVHTHQSGVTLRDYAVRLIEVFGDQARIALCYLLATLFRDIIYRKTRHFPILNLFGEKGSGKTTLATCLQAFFLHGIEPPNIGVTSVPAMNDRVSQAVNTLVVFDEYRNDLDVRKIQFFKGMWGGGGQTKKSAADGMASQTVVSTGVALCGQDKPTQDMALFTRLIFLQYNRTVFSAAEQNRCSDLVALCNMGLTHLTLQVLAHRALFEKNFAQVYALVKAELAARTADEEIHSRIFGNWVIPLAAFRVLETVLDLPFSYSELFDTALRGLRNQNEYAVESSEVADFWNTLQGLQTAGRCIEKAHFRIRYQRSFRSLSMREDMVFAEAKPILYLNSAAIAALMGGSRGPNANANRSNWTTILSYLKSHPSYLGLKQDRFVLLNAQGAPDYLVEPGTFGPTRKQKVIRPKALCFDYSQLKAAFGLTLETEMITDSEEHYEDTQHDEPPATPTLF